MAAAAASATVKSVAGLVQYVVCRRDLLKEKKWNLGAFVAQACHACNLAAYKFREDGEMLSYFEEGERMHKVVLEISDEEALRNLAETLEKNDVKHVLWVEHPENVATCIATKAYPKSAIAQHFKDLKLMR